MDRGRSVIPTTTGRICRETERRPIRSSLRFSGPCKDSGNPDARDMKAIAARVGCHNRLSALSSRGELTAALDFDRSQLDAQGLEANSHAAHILAWNDDEFSASPQ